MEKVYLIHPLTQNFRVYDDTQIQSIASTISNGYKYATQDEIDAYLLEQKVKQIVQYIKDHGISISTAVVMFINQINQNIMTPQQKNMWSTIETHLFMLETSAMLLKPWNITDGLRTQFKDFYETWSNTEKAEWELLHQAIVILDASSPFALVYQKTTP